jgi:hypothetical protein
MFANVACIQCLIAGRDIGKKEDPVSGVGCPKQDGGSVVRGVGQLRSDRESRDCVEGMMIGGSDGGFERGVMTFGFQTLNSVLRWML